MEHTHKIRDAIITSLTTAFIIVAALIWKDVIIEFIALIFPANELMYKILTAIIATIFVAIMIYILIKAEEIKLEKVAKQVKKLEEEIGIKRRKKEKISELG